MTNPSETDRVMRVLKAAPLLRSFTDTGLQILSTIVQEKRIPAGTPLFVENMIGDSTFIVEEGMVRISVRAAQGGELTLAMLGAHEVLGEVALLRSGPRMCTATAEVDTAVLEISRRDLLALQKTKPQACVKLMMCIIDQFGGKMAEAGGDFRQYLAWSMTKT